MHALVLRPEPQAARTAAALGEHSITTTVAPMLRIEHEAGIVDRVLDDRLPRPTMLVFTSANGVEALRADPEFDRVSSIAVRAVGATTADAARRAGFADVTAANGDGAALLEELRSSLPEESVVVHVAGRDRIVHVAEDLAAAGRKARTVVAYRAETSDTLDAEVAAGLATGAYDLAVVASRRTAETFRRALAGLGLPLPLEKPALLAISHAAAEPLVGALRTVEVAARPDHEALTEGVVALAAALAKNSGDGAEDGTRRGRDRGHEEPETMARDDRDGPEGASRRKGRGRSTTIDLTATEVRNPPADTDKAAAASEEIADVFSGAASAEAAEASVAQKASQDDVPPPVVDDSLAATAASESSEASPDAGVEGTTTSAIESEPLTDPEPALSSARPAMPEAEAPPRRSVAGSLAAAVVGGLVVLAGGLGLIATGNLPTGRGNGEVTAETVRLLDEKVAALGQRVDALPAPPPDLSARVAAVEEALSAQPADTDVSGEIASLAARIDAVSAAAGSAGDGTAAPAPDLAPLTGRIDAIAADLQSLSTKVDTLAAADLAGRMTAVDAAVAEFKTGLESVRADLDGLKTGLANAVSAGAARDEAIAAAGQRLDEIVARLDAGPKGGEIAALSLAATSLASRVASGQPFAADLALVRSAAPDVAGLDTLTASAATGIPTLETLAGSFPAEAILAVRVPPAEGAIVDRLFSGAKSLVNYRDTGPASADPIMAGVASIQAALAAGDVSATKAAADALPAEARQAGAAWFAELDRRAAADGVVAALTDRVLNRLQAPAEGQ